ncbi:AraC family transcriptional regulator [Reyranella sp.]|uniref:AraC family transcriptional regulator n=1 Tax=Reyranella sp. TaxID=1929291 RepID=UPI003D0A371E
MDPLGQTVALLRPKALLWKQMQANGNWTVRFPASTGVVFCFVASGHCEFGVEGEPPRALEQGDFLLLSRPPSWRLARETDAARPTVVVDYTPRAGGPERARFVGDASRPPEVEILGGRFTFDPTNADLLTGLVPRRAEILSHNPTGPRLHHLLALIRDESSSERAGQALVLERLLEVLLVEAIRQAPAPGVVAEPGLLTGLGDPQLAKALNAMHGDLRRPWTVERAARVAGLSRSAFAERFTAVVGLSPMDYLLRLRMALAKDRLRFGGARLAEVATACGYRSVSAFSTAFRRVVGIAPGAFASRP